MPLQMPRRPVSRLTVMLALALLAAIGVLIYLLVAGSSGGSATPGRHASAPATPGTAASRPKAASPTTVAQAEVPLTPVSATAFGPAGASQGDNPDLSALAVDGSTGTSWQTDWYSTAEFSGLKQGTGLLLDMGKNVSVSAVRVLLGAAPGGSFQLRAGESPQLASLPPVASADDTGGLVTVRLASPVSARYLLIWFVALPPDGSGTYQASVHNVSVTGAA